MEKITAQITNSDLEKFWNQHESDKKQISLKPQMVEN